MLKELKIPFFTVLFIFLGILLFIKLNGPIPFSVNSITTTKETLFTVDGTGEATAVPDTALINFGVNKQAATVESAKNEVNQIINKITEDIKRLGVNVNDIKTVNYSVYPNYDYANGRQRITGYSVNADIQVKMKPIDKANNAVDIATQDGATNVSAIQFVLDDNKQKEVEQQARKEAIKNAKEKAAELSQEAGIRLGRIVQVTENPQQNPRPYPMSNLKVADSAGAGAPPTELNPGKNKVSIQVTLSYETY